MFKRAFLLGLLLVSTQMAVGCCGPCGGGWCHRPYLFRPWCNRCASSPTDCCGGTSMSPGLDYGTPPLAPPGQGMPRATDLSRR